MQNLHNLASAARADREQQRALEALLRVELSVLKIPFTPECSLAKILAEPVVVRQWRSSANRAWLVLLEVDVSRAPSGSGKMKVGKPSAKTKNRVK